MQDAQDASSLALFKIWSWIENNKQRILIATGVIVVAAVIYSYVGYQHDQKEADASNALTRIAMSTPPGTAPEQIAKTYLQVAADHSGTQAAQRARLQGAAALFDAGKYADAQGEFQKFLDAHSESPLAPTAALGVAASLEAQGKLDAASTGYLKAAAYNDAVVILPAKFALGRIAEQQGKLSEAMNYYSDVAHLNPNCAIGNEAGIRAAELKSKAAAAKPVTSAKP